MFYYCFGNTNLKVDNRFLEKDKNTRIKDNITFFTLK